jgi:hypothetical protein
MLERTSMRECRYGSLCICSLCNDTMKTVRLKSKVFSNWMILTDKLESAWPKAATTQNQTGKARQDKTKRDETRRDETRRDETRREVQHDWLEPAQQILMAATWVRQALSHCDWTVTHHTPFLFSQGSVRSSYPWLQGLYSVVGRAIEKETWLLSISKVSLI